MSEKTFETIDRPYDDKLSRIGASSKKAGQPTFGNEQSNQYSGFSTGAGGTAVTSGNMLGDMWITTFIRSKNWKPKERGFTINGADGYAEFSNLHITGGITAAEGNIGGFTITADELYSTADGNKTSLSSGDIAFSVGPEGHPTATIMQNGLASFANISVSGGSITDTLLANLKAGSMPSVQGWTSDLVFSATNNTTIEWAEGDIKLVDGTTYAIVAGNTGVMTAITYIYIDTEVSSTVLQTSTISSDSVGTDKILIAVAEDNSDTASSATLQVFGGAGGQLLLVDNIAANSASTNEFITNTAQIKDAVISSAKVTSLVANKITAGTGVINSLSILSTLTMGSSGTSGIIQSYGWNGTVSGFNITGGTTPSFTLIGGVITGGIVQTKTTGYRVKMNGTSSALEFLNGDTIRGSIVTSAAGDIIIAGVDDVLMSAGGSIRVSVASSSFKPSSDGSYDLGASGNRWENGYINKVYTDKVDFGSWEIYDDSTNFRISYNGDQIARFESDGDFKPEGKIQMQANIEPTSNKTRDLGTSSNRWNNIYGDDLYVDEVHSDTLDIKDAIYIDGDRGSNGSFKDQGGNTIYVAEGLIVSGL